MTDRLRLGHLSGGGECFAAIARKTVVHAIGPRSPQNDRVLKRIERHLVDTSKSPGYCLFDLLSDKSQEADAPIRINHILIHQSYADGAEPARLTVVYTPRKWVPVDCGGYLYHHHIMTTEIQRDEVRTCASLIHPPFHVILGSDEDATVYSKID